MLPAAGRSFKVGGSRISEALIPNITRAACGSRWRLPRRDSCPARNGQILEVGGSRISKSGILHVDPSNRSRV
jgi:hypothetical protein